MLVGDHRQSPELSAGGAFRALARTLDPARLRENRRQDQPWERAALDELRHGEPAEALAAYVAHGRVATSPRAGDSRAALVAAWWQAAAAPRLAPPGASTGASSGASSGQVIAPQAPPRVAVDPKVVIRALRRADVAELNWRARAELRAAGLLGGTELTVASGPYTERSFAAGDLVAARRNAYRAGLVNGTRGRVDSVDVERAQLSVRFAGRTVTVPRDYLAAGGLDHGYALTVHQAQGLTARQALLAAGGELYREAGYVALSRARAGDRIYLSGGQRRARARPRDLPRRPPAAAPRRSRRTRRRAAPVESAAPRRRPAALSADRFAAGRLPPAAPLAPRAAPKLLPGRLPRRRAAARPHPRPPLRPTCAAAVAEAAGTGRPAVGRYAAPARRWAPPLVRVSQSVRGRRRGRT